MCLPIVHHICADCFYIPGKLCRKKLSAKTRELLKEEHLGILGGSKIRQPPFSRGKCPISTA